MKYKITDLMDLYEDENCPLAPAPERDGRAVNDRPYGETVEEPKEIPTTRHAFGWKEFTALAAALALVVLGGFGIKRLIDRGPVQPQQSGEPGQTEVSGIIPTDDVTLLCWEEISPAEQEELSRFLTCFAQQGVESLQKDLDQDAELIRFAFIYRRIYDPESITVQSNNIEELWDTLSPEQVNETLQKLLGRTVATPTDYTEYSLLRSEPVGGRCCYYDGYFWQEPSGEDHLLRFALATHVLNDRPGGRLEVLFTTYEVQLLLWPDVELDPLPALTTKQAADLTEEGKLKSLGEGRAVLQETDYGWQLLSYEPESLQPQPTEQPRVLSPQELKDVDPWLSFLAEQGIQFLDPNLEDEYELAQIAHIYTKLHQYRDITYISDDTGSYETLTLEQVNAVLDRLLGKSVNPKEGTDYTALRGDNYVTHESYHDGRFWWVAADGDLHGSFALADSGTIREESGLVTVQFTVYEAEYETLDQLGREGLYALYPAEAEALTAEGKLTRTRHGNAQLQRTGDGFRLMNYSVWLYSSDSHEDLPPESQEDLVPRPTGFDTVSDGDWAQFNGLLTDAARMGFPKSNGDGSFVPTKIWNTNRFGQATALLSEENRTFYEVAFEVYEADLVLWPEFQDLVPAQIDNVSELVEAGKVKVLGGGTASFERQSNGMHLTDYFFTVDGLPADTSTLDLLRYVDTEWRTETADVSGARTVRALTFYADGGLYYREGDPNSEFCVFVDGQWTADVTGSLFIRLWDSPYTAWDRPDNYLVSAVESHGDSWTADFTCAYENGVLTLVQKSLQGLGEDDKPGTELRFNAVCAGTSKVPEAGWQYEDERPAGLDFWLTQPLYAWDIPDHAEIYGMFGGRQFLGLGYEAVPTEDGLMEREPDQCVLYTCTAYPDYADGGCYVKSIQITDPAVSVYGLTVDSSPEEFEAVLRARGFETETEQTLGGTICRAEKNGLRVCLSTALQSLTFSVEVTNRDGIVF